MAGAIKNGTQNVIDENASNGEKLFHAVHAQNRAEVQRLLKEGADPNWIEPQSSSSALREAAEQADVNILDDLLADPRTQIELGEGHSGGTAMHAASRYNRVEAIEHLHAKGAKVDARDDSETTPLMVASQNNRKEATSLLLKKRAVVDARDKNLRTAMHYAVIRDNLDIEKLLAAAGADATLEDKNRVSPIDLADRKDLTVREAFMQVVFLQSSALAKYLGEGSPREIEAPPAATFRKKPLSL